MSKKDGLEVLDEMLEINKDLTVVMVSAMAQEDTVKESIKIGADHFIVKPFERDDLFNTLKGVLND